MDSYGLTERERQTHLHNYNHALFRNMMYFLSIEWEINVLAQTVFVLEDKNESDWTGKEHPYSEIYEEYLSKYIVPGDRETFARYLQSESLNKLQEEVSFDINLFINGEEELHNIVLTPAFDENGTLYCVYLGARNIQEEVRHELEEYRRQENLLHALLDDSYFYLTFDLSGDCMVKTDYYTIDKKHSVSEISGGELPVAYDDFIQKWMELYEPQFDRGDSRTLLRVENLKKLCENREHMLEMEMKIKNPDGGDTDSIMQLMIVMMTNPQDKHVWVYLILKDISLFQKKTIQDNLMLKNSNERLKSSLNQEMQYRMASLSGALLFFEFNLTKDRIEDEFYEIVDGMRIPMLDLVGLKPPCSFNEFCRRWCQAKVERNSWEVFLRTFNREYMLEQYAKGERHLEIEFDTTLGRNILLTLRNTAFFIEDEATGDIIAMVNSKDITEQRMEERRQRESLRDAYEAASNANTVKTDFLTRMSHDIRTPMNEIVGMTAIASKHLDNTTRVGECLNNISNAGKYMLAILSEVMDMSRIEAGKLKLSANSFNIEAMLENISTICDYRGKEKDHTFSIQVKRLIHKLVVGDEQRLQQVLMNLIDNAFKYTSDGGLIKLLVLEENSEREGEGCFTFVVEDNGIGMDTEYLSHIFEPFVRSEDKRVSRIQGTGLGLPIAMSIVQMMNGNIDVQSVLNRGTTITVTVYLKLASSDDFVSSQEKVVDIPKEGE